MMTKIVSRAATFELLKGLMAVGADRLVAITNTAPGANKIDLVRGQGLITFFTRCAHIFIRLCK
ncbi:hypothetical protein AW734_19130 [Pantoea ananatis]|nr:hypothetical protein AW734_19130 [Pantoea ananatis]